MHINKSRYLGFTMIELLVALAINIILLAALISFFSANLGHFNKVTSADALNQQLTMGMQLMINDIRRAGYWVNAKNDIGTHANTNPFMVTGTTDITVSGSCILFAYDHDKNGILPSISSSGDDERYGFRLNNQTLQTRPPGSTYSCTASSTAWENITDPNVVQITGLTFTLNSTTLPVGATSRTILVRSVDISITGQLVSDPTITKTLSEHVRIRNDKYVP